MHSQTKAFWVMRSSGGSLLRGPNDFICHADGRFSLLLPECLSRCNTAALLNMPDTRRPYVRSVASGGPAPAGAGICKRGSTPADGRGSEGSARLNCTEGTRVLGPGRPARGGGPGHLPLKPGDQWGLGTGRLWSSSHAMAAWSRG